MGGGIRLLLGSSLLGGGCSGRGGCSGAVGGWSNYYAASCVISWFAGCEGAPALPDRPAPGRTPAPRPPAAHSPADH